MTVVATAPRLPAPVISIGVMLFGMLWMAIMLMQDFDYAGRMKAVLIAGLAVAAVSLTRLAEQGRTARVPARGILAGLLATLFVFTALSPSRLTWAEAVVLTALALAPLALQAIAPRWTLPIARLPILLTGLCVLLALVRLAAFALYLHAPDMEDIGRTTIAAVHAVFAGQNPYALPLDLHPEYPEFSGYKYLPVMIATYAPLVALFDEAGLRMTNLFLDAGMSLAIYLAARRAGGTVAGLLALIAWLMLPILPRDVYKHGVTDLAPVLPLVVALTLSSRRLGVSGLMIGLSVGAKLFPGLLMALCCLRRQRVVYYFIGGIAGILPAIAFWAWSPADFTRNVFLFILTRPLDETSWMFGLPPIVPTIAKAAYFLFLLAILIHLLTATPGMARRCGLIMLCIFAAVLTGPDAHNNYILWWVPFFCILLGALVSSIVSGNLWPSADGKCL